MKNKIKSLFTPCLDNDFRARILRTRFLFSLLVVVFALRIAFLPLYIPFSKSLFFSEIVSSEMVHLLNQERRTQDLPVLTPNPRLARAAELKAEHMLKEDYFAHKSPKGITGWHFIEQTGYDYSVAGENLAIGFLDSVEIHTAWNNSPLHKRNLLDPRFEEVGVSVLSGEFEDSTTTVVVQLFGQPASEAGLEEREPVSSSAPQTPPPSPSSEGEHSSAETMEGEKTAVAPEPVLEPTPEPEALAGPIRSEEKAEATEPRPEKLRIEEGLGKPGIGFWTFFIKRYNRIAQKGVLFLAGTLGSILVLNIGLIITRPLDKNMKTTLIKKLVLEGGFSFLILLFLGIINKAFIIQFIPHTMRI